MVPRASELYRTLLQNQRLLHSLHIRSFSTQNCPFHTLGVSKSSSYTTVKTAFLKLAIQHHPDTSSSTQNDAETFVQIRNAFEQIQELEDGSATLRRDDYEEEESLWKSENEFQDWFRTEIGNLKMDARTIREITRVVETHQPGGLDRGGMWSMARMIAQNGRNVQEVLGVGREHDGLRNNRPRRRRR